MSNREDWIDFSDYAAIIRHSWMILVLCGLVGYLAASLVTSLQTPQFVAEVEMVLDRPAVGVLMPEESMSLARPDDTFYHTQTRILRSELLLKRTIDALKSGAVPAAPATDDELPSAPPRHDADASWRSEGVSTITPALSQFLQAQSPPELLRELAAGLAVDFVPRTRIFMIQTRSHNPEYAAAAANALAGVYAQYVSETFASSTERSFLLLQRQTEEASRRIKSAAESLLAFKRDAEVASLTGASSTNQAVDTKLRISIRERLAAADTEIATLRDELTQTDLNVQTLSKKYQSKHPEMAALLSRREQLTARIEQLKDRTYANWESKHRQERTEIEYSMLEQDLEATRRLHDTLVAKMKEIDFTKESPVTTAKVLKRAKVPGEPALPRRKLNMIMGTLSGLMFGLVVALMRARIKARRVTVSSCERLTSIPVIAWLPHFRAVGGLRDVLSGKDNSSPDAEAFKALRTSVDAFSRPGGNVVLITSPERGDGKSTVSTGLAQSFSKLRHRILLIDVDLRRGRLHEILLQERVKGLSDYLSGDDTVTPINIDSNFDFLPCGQLRDNPGEALASKRMEDLLLRVSREYYVVILDSPPLLPVTDAAILARYTDTRLMVVRCDSTDAEALKMANRLVENLGYEFSGIIVNDVQEEHSTHYRYYRREYDAEDRKSASAS